MALFKAIRDILLSAGQTSTIGGGVQILSTADQDSNGLNSIKVLNASGSSKGYVGYRQNDLAGLEIAGGNGSNSAWIQLGASRFQVNTAGAESAILTCRDGFGTVFNGAIAPSYVSRSSNSTATSLTSTIDCTNTITITLPTAVGCSGRIYTIKNSGTGVVTIATTSSQTIDGATTQRLVTQWSKITVQSTGANWIIISDNSPLADALGTTPDADATTYIASAGITKLEQQIGINKLITYLKAESLWTTLNGGFLFGNDVQKSGTSLIDLKAGASATLTGGSRGTSGILLNGASADEISFGARTFTSNLMPSVYLLYSSYVRTTTTSSNRINFGPLSDTGTYRGFQPTTHGGTGSNSGIHNHCYRGDNVRYFSSVTADVLGSFVGCAFSSADQKHRNGENACGDGVTGSIATTSTFSAGATWLLGPFENTSKTSTEITIASACLFWDSNVTITQRQTSDIDSLIRSFAL